MMGWVGAGMGGAGLATKWDGSGGRFSGGKWGCFRFNFELLFFFFKLKMGLNGLADLGLVLEGGLVPGPKETLGFGLGLKVSLGMGCFKMPLGGAMAAEGMEGGAMGVGEAPEGPPAVFEMTLCLTFNKIFLFKTSSKTASEEKSAPNNNALLSSLNVRSRCCWLKAGPSVSKLYSGEPSSPSKTLSGSSMVSVRGGKGSFENI